MHPGTSEFLAGFVEGARETPRAFFAPLVAVWRLLLSTTQSLIASKRRDE
jgi:hypothetical protein